MPCGPASERRLWKSPLAESTAVTLKFGKLRMMYWSIREPSLEAKNFCSFTKASEELMKLTPLTFSAASFSFSRKPILSSSGMSNGSFSKLLLQLEDKIGFLLKLNEAALRSEEHTSELQSRSDLVCRLLLE